MEEPENFTLRVGGELFEATPDNTTLQEYAGHLCMFNNIVLEEQDENGETTDASIIFSFSESYQPLRQIIEDHHFPMYLNIPHVGEGVMKAYISTQTENFDDELDGLLDGTG